MEIHVFVPSHRPQQESKASILQCCGVQEMQRSCWWRFLWREQNWRSFQAHFYIDISHYLRSFGHCSSPIPHSHHFCLPFLRDLCNTGIQIETPVFCVRYIWAKHMHNILCQRHQYADIFLRILIWKHFLHTSLALFKHEWKCLLFKDELNSQVYT